MNSIAFIESNTTGTGERFLIAAKNLGLKVIFLTATPEKYTFLQNLLIHPVIIDTDDSDLLYHYIKEIPNLVGITSTSESFIYNAAIVAKKCGLPHPNPAAIANCRDKYRFNELLKEARLPAITTTKNLQEKFDFPVVVKPNTGTGSIGVKLCHTLDELTQHINSLSTSDVLIQEYIKGEEYSAEIVVADNKYHFLGITKKHLGPEPYFVEYGHDFPAILPDKIYEEVVSVLTKALQKVNFYFGPVHIEFRIVEEKIYIIEINPRLAGGMIPILIEHAKGIRLIENLIKMFIGMSSDFQLQVNFFAKIAFIIPKQEGIIKQIPNVKEIGKQAEIVEAFFSKNVGDHVTLKGDFSDRIGFVIAKAETAQECSKSINDALTNAIVLIDSELYTHGRDRLAEPLDPRVREILEHDVFSDLDDLKFLSQINNAHVMMLERCKIISNLQATTLLNAIRELKDENFESVHSLNNPSIGFYLAYEQRLVEKIGVDIAGVIHTARSRNDINATIQRFKSKEVFKVLYKALWGLRSDLLQIAARNLNISMPIYSQYQAAMPASYAYYLIAVENSLALCQSRLREMFDSLNVSTLGGSSGAGTTYPIDPRITAELLGFSTELPNALTVVASRDLELMLLSLGAVIGVNVSRIAQDFHLWLTHEFAFFELPDRLCGISSAMPQKKNPYLLEKIKGKAIGISGKLTAAMATMQKVPFSNSVEVGTESLIGYIDSFSELIKSIKLLSLIVQNAKPIQKNMDRSNKEGLTVATAIAENLAQSQNISCREAHGTVANAIKNAILRNQDPLNAILLLVKGINSDPNTWHKDFEYGNGPGLESTTKMLKKSVDSLNFDGNLLAS